MTKGNIHVFLIGAISRYFITKRQEEAAKRSNKFENEKKKRASYERKKEIIEMCILVVNILFNSPGSIIGLMSVNFGNLYDCFQTPYNLKK